MFPKAIKNTLQIFGLIISVILIIQPWFYTTNSDDPFLFSSWHILCCGILASCLLAVIYVFFRPKKGQIPFIKTFFLLFLLTAFLGYQAKYLVILRTSVFIINAILLITFLRLTRRRSDNHAIISTIAVSGALMALYCILQSFGYDFFDWRSKENVIGTLANTNYAGIYLIISSIITLGAVFDIRSSDWRGKTAFTLMFLLQAVGVLLCRKLGINICFTFSLFVFFAAGIFEKYPGRYFGRNPIMSGLVVALLVLLAYGSIYYKVASYSWETITTRPVNISFVARLLLWKMGFEVFLSDPIKGGGPGSLQYSMQINRPPNADVFGISEYNPDPHAVPVSILGEMGFLGFWLICSFLCISYAVYIRKQKKRESVANINDDSKTILEVASESAAESAADKKSSLKEWINKIKRIFLKKNDSVWQLPWANTFIAFLILWLSYKAGYISIKVVFYSIPFIAVFCGVYNLFARRAKKVKNSPEHTDKYQSRGVIAAITGYIFYSLFNNSFDAVPVSGLMILVFTLNFSLSLFDVKWERRFSSLALFYLLLPLMFSFSAYTFQIAHHIENKSLYLGRLFLGSSRPESAIMCFNKVLQNNPQSLKGFHGAAISYEQQGMLDKAQEMYKRLDRIVPNAFGANYYLAKILLESGNILEAHRYALKNIERERLPSAFELLGRVLIYEGKQSEAIQILTEGIIFIPNFYHEKVAADRIRFLLANFAAENGDYKSCKMYLNEMNTSYKNERDVSYLNGMLYSKEQEYDKALEIFEQILANEPENPLIMNAVGYILTQKNEDLERAQELLEAAYLKIREKEPVDLANLLMLAHSLGKLYWKQNKLNEAGDLLKIAYEQSPEDWKALKEERLKDLEEFNRQSTLEASE